MCILVKWGGYNMYGLYIYQHVDSYRYHGLVIFLLLLDCFVALIYFCYCEYLRNWQISLQLFWIHKMWIIIGVLFYIEHFKSASSNTYKVYMTDTSRSNRVWRLYPWWIYYLTKLPVVHIGHEGLRSSQNVITLLKYRTDRSFVKTASVLWNHLPLSLKLANTLGHFISGLTTYLDI